jgi:exodeoxyribonuclease-1
MGETFLFYDIETSGLNRAFDQILDFAAVRTDGELEEIDRVSIQVRLRPDVVPSPAAMIVNRIPVEALDAGRTEYEAVQQIHAQLNRAGTTSIGYNSIGFDDEFLRFAFHRNLLPPYTHQFAHACRRMDLLPIAVMFWLYKPQILAWPETNGKSSLKLEDIGAANGLFTGRSHDALADAEAAWRLARRLRRETRMWNYLDGCFRREVDARRIEELPVAFVDGSGEHRLAVMVSSEFGTRQRFLAPVLFLEHSIPYPKQGLWLRLDLPRLQETEAKSVAETTWVLRKRPGEPGILLPPHERYLDRMDPTRRGLMAANLEWLRSHAEIFARIIGYHRDYRYPFVPRLDADASLYQSGFLSKADEELRRRYHAAPLPERIALARRFQSADARALGLRILWRNFDGELAGRLETDAVGSARALFGEDAGVDTAGRSRTTPEGALAEIGARLEAADTPEEERRRLADLARFIRRRFAPEAGGGPG